MERSEQLTEEQERYMRDEPMPMPDRDMTQREADAMRRKASEANQKSTGLDQCANTYRPNPRALIEERIMFHNRAAQNLHDLLRGIPQEMSRGAEDALLDLLKASRVAGQGSGV